MNLIIVGCGSIGSKLGIISSFDPRIENLYLIDNELLEYKNIPYILGLSSNEHKKYISCPKINLLKDYILKINNNIIIKEYKELVGEIKNKKDNSIYVDCRDRKSCDMNFNLRLRYDGIYGSIIKNPNFISSVTEKGNYELGNFNLYSFRLCKIVYEEFIFNNDKEDGVYYYDLEKFEEYYPYSGF